jgi:hypothetical protein
MDPGEFSRALEAYLCRKNDGHLVRIVGPAFEKVCGWAEQGVPLKVAYQGIDRCFERYYAKGPRRRPVRIEFCEADVLDAFDDWRRAVGVAAQPVGAAGSADRESARRSLPAHLQRVVEKLTNARAEADDGFAAAVDRALDAIEELRTASASFRGPARTRAVERLAEIDRELMGAARQAASADLVASLRREAAEELAAYAGRLPASEYARALESAMSRLLRGCFRLPRVEFEG